MLHFSLSVVQLASTADIGNYVKATLSAEETDKAVKHLPAGEKYTLLKHHSVPSDLFVFPITYAGGCNRNFRMCWLKEHPWLVYSQVLDGAFCIPCALFCMNRGNRGQLVNKPFIAWQKKSEKFKEHERAHYHQESLELAEAFIHSVENPEHTVPALSDQRRAANIERNRSVLKIVTNAVLYCARQCIGLRGDSEKLDSPGNPGNFLSFYMSSTTQNELIDIISNHIILRELIDEIKSAKFFAVMADEVTSHNREQLALCVRFVDKDNNIREEFVQFKKVERITGKYLADVIINTLKSLGLEIKNLRGQGYDGAANMSSPKVGVQAQIRKEAPLATYIHCSGHCLNLVISHSCAFPQIRNALDKMKNVCLFFKLSPKRNELLELIVEKNLKDHESKRKAILELCKTRWAARQEAYQHFYQSYAFIVDALEMIGYGYTHHIDKYGDLYADWDTANRSEAQQILRSITNFEFLVVFMSLYQYLSHLAGITVQLQKSSLDIIKAHNMIEEVKEVYTSERANVDSSFAKIYAQAVRFGKTVKSDPAIPTVTTKQQHRYNIPSFSVEEHYKRNVAIPLLDHIISSLDERFTPLTATAVSLLGLVPAVLCQEEIDMSSVLEMYGSDLPSPELFTQELTRWKLKYMKIPCEARPKSPAAAIKECDRDHFPNIIVLLQIACTLPVTSCECERSASALKRLNTYMRASMGQERLSSLALIHIHYDQHIDLDAVVDIYARIHPRRLQLDSLIKPLDTE